MFVICHLIFHYNLAKPKTTFVCRECGAAHPKWQGQCDDCGAWSTLEEQKPLEVLSRDNSGVVRTGKLLNFDEVKNSQNDLPTRSRVSTCLSECDNVLGGGLYPQSLNLLVGDPGVGKSTLSLQIARNIAEKTDGTVLIVSGEESAWQVLSRLKRFGTEPKNLKIANSNSIDDVYTTCQKMQPRLLVVDSVQTFVSQNLPSAGGSLVQVRAVTEVLMTVAKKMHIPVLLIGQVTKEGTMAGPQTLAHLVDVVMQISGDSDHDLRLLQCSKNRFGPTNSVGIFRMTEKGLETVTNPSEAFLSGRQANALGSVIFPTLEGSRAFLIELQALTAHSPFGMPKRSSSGFPLPRLHLLLAVLSKFAGLKKLAGLDVFANVVGGYRSQEPAADLAMCAAIISSQLQKPLGDKVVVLGEVGLSGEVRAVRQLETRLKEAEKLGFEIALVPPGKHKLKTKLKLEVIQNVSNLMKFF